jgi:hypothetical protein
MEHLRSQRLSEVVMLFHYRHSHRDITLKQSEEATGIVLIENEFLETLLALENGMSIIERFHCLR